MAFVHRTERIIHIAPAHPTSELGPGQYLSATNPTKGLKPSKAPFYTSSVRQPIGGRSKTPGVGSYNIDAVNKKSIYEQAQRQKFLDYKPILTEGQSKLNGSANSNAMKDFLNKAEGAFSSRVVRFKDKREDLENPGPGQYIKESEFKAIVDKRHQIELMEKKNPNFKPITGSNCRVLSIPNKYQGYGYEIVDDKMVLLNEDPDLPTKFDGIDLKVGPGNYELDKPVTWHQRGTSWSKSKVDRSLTAKNDGKKEVLTIKGHKKSMDETQSTFYKSVIEKEMSKTSQSFFDKRNDKELVYKHLKNRNSLYKVNVNIVKQRNLDGINRLVYEESPGPGYYFNKTFTNGFKKEIPPENTQNFGSTCNRFEVYGKNNANLGPGSYFVKRASKHKKKPASITEAPFNIQSKRIPEFGMSETDNPGPGFYNPLKDNKHHKRAYSCKNIMYTDEKRFPNSKYSLKTPGPGAYDEFDQWNKLSSNEIIRMLNPQGVNMDRIIIPLEKDIKPPVGSYNSDMITNLDYKVAKKVNRNALVNAPFESFTKRFKEERGKIDTLGPGGYIKINKTPIEQVYPPFKESDIRFKKQKNLNANLGPGLYNPQNNWTWNQKTYNILYIDNEMPKS